jgi:hypothetical protein
VAAVAVAVALAACSGGGSGAPDDVTERREGHNAGPTPTLSGGVALDAVDPSAVLVGAGLAFGSPLPSEAAAADAFLDAPEVAAAVVRRVLDPSDGRHLADVTVLTLDGRQIFDLGVLTAFADATVAALGGGQAERVSLAGRDLLQVTSPAGVTVGFLQGDLLIVVRGGPADAVLVATRQLEAIARGEVGSVTPVTPLLPTPADSAFVPVPAVTFAPIPPPEEEPAPVPPALVVATAVQGRYGVVGGERRTVVWSFSLDPRTYPSAESVEPAIQALAGTRAGAASATSTETIDRVVFGATGPDDGSTVRAFRHKGLVLVVEGARADQVDAVTTAWIAALGPG